jgi:Family of unknown function (DUF5681)
MDEGEGEGEGAYRVGRGKPPLHSRFKKGRSGNPRGPRPKNLPALLVRALNEPVVVTADGQPRQITKREAVVAQLVDKSTGADLRATKMLIDLLKDIERRAGMAPPPKASPVTPADEEVVQTLLARLRRMELAKIHHADTEA